MNKVFEKLEEAKSNVPVNRLLDDVCEWKKDNMFETVYRVCDGFYTNVYRNDFEYCPYCGKKIKVVE